MKNIEDIIESAVVHGQLISGVSPALVAARSSLGRRGIAVLSAKNKQLHHSHNKSLKWRYEEDNLLRSCLGILPEEDIAEMLGRSVTAVHLRWSRDMCLPAPSKNPDFLTCNQIALGLGVDSKSVARLIAREILPGRVLPLKDTTRVVKRITLLRFLTNPINWIYFDPNRIGCRKHNMARGGQSFDAEFWSYARRLVKKRQSLWKDEWWRSGKVAKYHGIDHRFVRKAIAEGRLPATKWGNWHVLKSHATAPSLCIIKWVGRGGKGYDHFKLSPSAEAFLIIASAVGLMRKDIGRMMKLKTKTISYLLLRMHRQGKIRRIISEHGLKVRYNKKTGELCANWRLYKARFPWMSRLMKREKLCSGVTRAEKIYITRIKKKTKLFMQQRGALIMR